MPEDAVAVASDHAGFALKQELAAALRAMNRDVMDLGVDDTASVDYPDLAYALVEALRDGRAGRGILVCGSGIGMSIAANRFAEIRAALVHDSLGARLARQHNDANVLCLGGRMIGADVAIDCLRAFLETPFEGGRHVRRVDKLTEPR